MNDLYQTAAPLIAGLLVTVKVTAGGAAVALAAAFFAGLARLSQHRIVRWPAAVYVEIFRGTSALVQLFWFFFVLPLFGIDLGAMAAAILVLGLNTGAYGAEVVRGAVLAVPRGQREAAVALNLSRPRTMFGIVLPQAIPAMLPPAGNLTIELMKNSALVSLIAITDLTFAGQLQRSATLQSGEVFTSVLLLYFALALCITGGFRLIERRIARRGVS